MVKYNPKMMAMFGQSASIFGMALLEIAKDKTNIIALSADMSTTAGLDKFKAAFPDRFYNFGIAEQNMVGAAAGLASEGFLPVCTAQSCFLSMRDFEQVRQYCGYMGKKIIFVGLHSGFSLAFLGKTHFALEDIALMRSVPGMTVYAPCDAMEAVKAFEAAIDNDGPSYIRLFGGTGSSSVYTSDFGYKTGEANVLREGSDVQIIAAGSMVSVALSAADVLQSDGIQASVIDMHTIKPLDENAIDLNAKLIVTLEEHFLTGGVGSAVADVLACRSNHPRLLKLGVKNLDFRIGDYNYLLSKAGLTKEQVAEGIKNVLNQ